MGYTEDYRELYYETIELLGELGVTTGQMEYVLKKICDVFETDAAYVYSADYPGSYVLKFSHQLPDTPPLPNGLEKNWLLTRGALQHKTIVNIPLHDEENQIVGMVGVARVFENPLLHAKMHDLIPILLVIGNHFKLTLLQLKVEYSRRSYESTLDSTGVGIYVTDFHTGDILYANREISQELGGLDNILNKKCWEVFADSPEAVACDFCPKDKLLDDNGKPFASYTWEYHRETDDRWFNLISEAFYWVDGRMAQVISRMDITQNKRNQLLIEKMAFFDSLTDIPNRRKFEIDFQEALQRSVKSNVPGYVLFIDLDHFKRINDVFGHETGDQVLIRVAQFVHSHPDFGGNIYRFGGDEFTMFFEGISEDEVIKVANAIIEKFREPWRLGDNDIYCTVSVGIASYPRDGVTYDDLLITADKAMYDAKRKGKSTLSLFRPADDNEAEMLAKEFALRHAIAGGFSEFLLLVHPIVEAKSSRWIGAEVLVRWNSSTHGILRPREFIPLCEQLELISQIGRWIIEESCKIVSQYTGKLPDGFYLSINTSIIQTYDDNFAIFVNNCLNKYNIRPQQIVLEITETVSGNDLRELSKCVSTFQAIGVKVAIDGFGMGYSTLSALSTSSFDMVKIDRSFIMHCLDNEFDRTFTSSMASLAHAADTQICAEGVWNSDIRDFLLQHNYDYLQGEYFSEPLTFDKFMTLMEKNNCEVQ